MDWQEYLAMNQDKIDKRLPRMGGGKKKNKNESARMRMARGYRGRGYLLCGV